jgi:hypothetical protein
VSLNGAETLLSTHGSTKNHVPDPRKVPNDSNQPRNRSLNAIFQQPARAASPLKAPTVTATVIPALEKPLSLAEFASAFKNAGHQDVVRSLFNLELILLKRDSSASPRQRDEATKAIKTLLDKL